jgi:hypothetical protein
MSRTQVSRKIQLKYFMLCNVSKKRESESIKERRKIYVVREFFDKPDIALFKYRIDFVKSLIISLKKLINQKNLAVDFSSTFYVFTRPLFSLLKKLMKISKKKFLISFY